MAPGRYTFSVSSGGGFFGPGQDVTLDVRSGQRLSRASGAQRLFEPQATGWYAADLHHHADQAEGVTPPEFLARSQFAAGLDLLFVSDHDSTANHATLQQIATTRGMPFIPSMELSPSWGHFNAWPLQPGQALAIDTGTATHRPGARRGATPGRDRRAVATTRSSPTATSRACAPDWCRAASTPRSTCSRSTADVPYDAPVMAALWQAWNAGHRYYLSGGTDVHDVWNHSLRPHPNVRSRRGPAHTGCPMHRPSRPAMLTSATDR